MPFPKGFTLLELLVVMGILAIVTIATVPILANTVGRTQLETHTQELVDILRRAQSQAVSSMGNSGWGVHLTTTQYTLFKGTTYNGSDPDNVVFAMINPVTISTISLNAGSVDVRFAKRKGTTNDFGTITLTDSNSGDSKTLSVTAVGKIDRP